MKISRRRAFVGALLALSLTLGAGVFLRPTVHAQTPARPAAAGNDIADQISRLVENGKIDELARLNIPDSGPTLKLHDWTNDYVSQIHKQDEERDKQYADAVTKAQDELKLNHYDLGTARIVLAYRIAKDPDAFLKLPWVADATAKVAAQAKDLEDKGQWLESLELYSDLNTLYEIDTRYKADFQRLNNRTRLLAIYTPQVLFDMRKALDAKEAAAATSPATKPAEDEAPPSFTRWQDFTEKVSIDMMRDSLDLSASDWVEKTDYQTLIGGGLDSLGLFLTTPELAKEFTGLADADNRKKFAAALDAALTASKDVTGGDDLEAIVSKLISVSNDSVKIPKEVIIMEFTDGAIGLMDPFTAVIWPHELDEFEKGTTGKFGGVGIQISMENGQLKVISPLEDSPAYQAGIQAGDVVTAIDGKSTAGISIDAAVHTITGDPGSKVVLRIKHANGKEEDYSITRAEIKVASIKGFQRDPLHQTKWDFMIDPDSKIGYIRITGFQEDTAADLRDALSTLKDQKLRGLILDLRFNPGGLLKAAVDISDMFLTDGTIVSTRGRTARAGAQSWSAHASTEIPPDMPMVVLVNEYSASASEIFSGAMKDLKRALIVGHRSFGKGSVQNLLRVGAERQANGDPVAMMKLTMAYYYLPNGESLHRRDKATKWGVDPDVVVDLTPDQLYELQAHSRDSEIIHSATETHPATTTPATPFTDTQLNAALLMMRLQLLQPKP